jgi:predicted O-linked N-acetylglucosamine transferase (SPINDLY family)
MLKKFFRHMLTRSAQSASNASGLQTSRGPAWPAERLGHALERQARGDLNGAEKAYRLILAEQPEYPAALHLLGHVLILQGRTAEAVPVLSRAAVLMPEDADVSFNLAHALQREGRLPAAEQALQSAVASRPKFVAAWLSLAGVMMEADRLDGAEDCFRRTLEIEPGFAEAHYNYGNLLHREGRIGEAIMHYRAAVDLKPDFVRAHSNLVYALNFSNELSPREVFDEHREWARRHADPLAATVRPHPNPRTMGRPLRVGYVSANFRDHAVTYFFESTLMHHDPERVSSYCYSDVERPDACTERLRRAACVWRDITGQDDESVAELVRRDGIDILVDLTGHTENHRLLTFARKPAPLQVTWNGYANTTGMSAIDYRITDALADPPGMTEHLHSEKLVRLPEIYMAFTPPAASPDVSAAPMLAAGHISFGSFNALSKVTPQVIRVWSDILRAIPRARLLMFTVPAGRTRDRLFREFASHGISDARLELIPKLPFQQFLAAHSRVDIALDPFPFSGTTTTCQTLWMGIPVVTLAGTSHVSRVGVTMLSSVGLEQCVAGDENDYVSTAVALATDTSGLQKVRSGLRERMLLSPLAHGARLTRFLEDAYAKMWEDYCRGSAGAGA